MLTLSASIFSDLFAGSALNAIFDLSLLVGVIYAVFLLFFQGVGEALGDLDLDFDADLDVDADAGDVGEATGISMLAIASFVSSFGAFGLISVTLFDAGTLASLFVALFGGLIVGIAAQLFFVYVLSPTISSEVRQANLIGMVAEVTTPIPVNGVGQIAFIAEGSRMTYSARSTEEPHIFTRGTPVRIERIVGGVAYVSPIQDSLM